ncbi:L,D-transpeptidase family protein [Peptococcaceae bacterium 1198_IL3148]
MYKNLIPSLVIALLLSIPVLAEGAAEQILINKGTNQLAFYQDNRLTKVFPIATGSHPSFTPEGNFYIANKIINPPYYKKNIPGGSPYNPLGPRWLGLSYPGGAYGIHGNSNAASIGTYASEGCIRLYNQDIIWLYDQVFIGTPVKIVNNNTDLNTLLEPETAILTVNGNYIPENCKAIIVDQDVMIALRPLAEYLGYTISWNNNTNSILVANGQKYAELKIKDTTVTVNSEPHAISKAPIMWNNNTYVPIDFFDNILGFKASWNVQEKHVDITNPSLYLPTE